MKSKLNLSRRGFLQAMSAAAGAAAGGRLAGQLIPSALAQNAGGPEKNVLVVLYMNGGYNSLFGSADSFKNQSFGVNDGNITSLGNNLFVDKPTFGDMLPAEALSKMASIGVRHGITSHEQAHRMLWTDGNRSYALRLANEMGGDAAIKCAALGDRPDMDGVSPPAENGVSFQVIANMDATIRALGGGTPDPRIPNRDIAAKALLASHTMSGGRLGQNAKSLQSMKEGYDTAIETLKKPVKPFSFADIANAYGHPTDQFGVGSFRSKMVAAELMVMAGANVITVDAPNGWDTHGDTDGSDVRNRMMDNVLPQLSTFLGRMLANPEYNVVLTIMGEFARSLPGSDHQPNLTTTVVGKYVKTGTTGRVDGDVGLPNGTPGIPGYWSYLAKAVKCATEPFGANPHALIL